MIPNDMWDQEFCVKMTHKIDDVDAPSFVECHLGPSAPRTDEAPTLNNLKNVDNVSLDVHSIAPSYPDYLNVSLSESLKDVKCSDCVLDDLGLNPRHLLIKPVLDNPTSSHCSHSADDLSGIDIGYTIAESSFNWFDNTVSFQRLDFWDKSLYTQICQLPIILTKITLVIFHATQV